MQMHTFDNDSNLSANKGPDLTARDTALLPSWLRKLPRECWKLVTKPGVDTISEAMGRANWLATGLLSILLLLSINLLNYLLYLASALLFHLKALEEVWLWAAQDWATILFTPPLYVLLSIVILYGLARLFGGRGTFLATLYTNLLFQVPLVLLTTILSFIPLGGNTWLNIARVMVFYMIQLYSAVLQVFSLRAVHKLSRGRAIICVLLWVVLSILPFIFLGLLIL